jgi:uncharacterized protein
MTRAYVLEKLSAQLAVIREIYHVERLMLFGSIARDEATEHSDADILVAFTGGATFNRYMDLKFFLEDLLGSRIDLVTENAVRPGMRPIIEQEGIRVA